MAKLMNRTSERTLMRKHNEPSYQPWSDWEICEGSQGLTVPELKSIVNQWHSDDERYITGSDNGWQMEVRTPYSREQYRIED